MDEKVYIFEGKTSTEAIEKGLKELRTTKNRVDIKILEDEDKKTFFSILSPKVVKVEIRFKQGMEPKKKEIKDINQIVQEIKKFMNDFISKLPVDNLKYQVKEEKNLINVNINDERAAFLIGYRGETLNCLQNILSNIASNDKQEKVRVLLNISGYREKREKDLTILSNKIADSVIKTRKSITLEPMSSFDRKIVHSVLQDNEKVTTYSVGKEPYRKVVVAEAVRTKLS